MSSLPSHHVLVAQEFTLQLVELVRGESSAGALRSVKVKSFREDELFELSVRIYKQKSECVMLKLI